MNVRAAGAICALIMLGATPLPAQDAAAVTERAIPVRVLMRMPTVSGALAEAIRDTVDFELRRRGFAVRFSETVEIVETVASDAGDGTPEPADAVAAVAGQLSADQLAAREIRDTRAAYHARVPFLLTADVRQRNRQVDVALRWYFVERLLRAEDERSGELGLAFDSLIVTALNEVLEAPAGALQTMEQARKVRRGEARALVLSGGTSYLTIAGELAGDINPHFMPVGYIGYRLQGLELDVTFGIEVSYFDLYEGGPPGAENFLVPVFIDVRWGFGTPAHFFARLGAGLTLLALYEGKQNYALIPAFVGGFGLDLPLAGDFRLVADLALGVQFAGDTLLMGVRPGIGLMLVL